MNNISDLLAEAGLLMLVGMAVVFVFLTMLIYATKLLTKIAEAFPEPAATTPTNINKKSISSSDQTSPQVIAAIGAAIAQHRKKNQ